ncbi:MAG: rod shape-determining protein RodA [Phycisphaerales bacterium]|nr:MAG: rod shape-determining protein RodA [Phycisphaerales bacterium]
MHKSRATLRNVGWLCVVAALLLNIVGIAAINTAPDPYESGYAQRQIVHLAVGLLAAVVVAVPHYQRWRRLSYPGMLIMLLLLVFVLVPWVPEVIVRPRNGARRWISLLVTDFQPSELAKIAYVLALANYLRFRRNYRRFLGLLLPLLLTFIPMGLVLIEPDLGTAMLFLPTLFAMLIAAGAKIRHLLIIIVLGLSMAPAMYPLLKPHQEDRIKAMIAQVRGDERYVNDIGYQGARAMTLVAAGRLTGVGREKARELAYYNHLPESHNDMIFAVICCSWGMMGALITWALFAVLCLGGILTAALCKDPFGRLVAVGLTAALFAQVTINNGMTVGLMPITGMTLPFVSYGGSSLVTAWLMIGLLFNIATRRPQYLSRHSFEFDEPSEDERYGVVAAS